MSVDSTKNDDESLFRSEIGDVTPLKSDNKIRLKKKPKIPNVQPSALDEDFNVEDVFSDGLSDTEIFADCPEVLSFARSGLQHSVLKKLRQGKNPIEHSLDLHGLTVDQARIELITFLSECESANIRHAIIVHGKGFGSNGKPVIKPMINRWLPQVANVLAFHSAQPKDGGNGAVYVLLKKVKLE